MREREGGWRVEGGGWRGGEGRGTFNVEVMLMREREGGGWRVEGGGEVG